MTIKQKQHLLAYLGYYTGVVDGIGGPMTQRATEAFQQDYCENVDGDFGPETEKRIREVIATGEEPKRAEDITGTFWDDIRYFDRDENGIACPCGRCGGFPVEPAEKLMRIADRVRDHFGAPMIPSSTVRCQTHNDELPGSVPNSRHVRGKAMDFCVSGFSADMVLAYVSKQKDIRYAYAIDSRFVHMDIE